jgi:hypothetical protein
VLGSNAAVASGVNLEVVQPGTSPADTPADAAPAGSASARSYRPTIHTRAQWGADESIRRGNPGYGQVHVAFVHHTDGSNTYSQSDVPAILRGIYTFHVKGRGWNDIGYNFLVDRWGRIWEGRYGGVTKAVIGAHTLNYNSGSFGVSVMGTFTTHAPPSAVKDALAHLIAWKLSIHGIQLPGSATINGKTFWLVSGHRDANSTACPGQLLYNALPAIRRSVIARMGTLTRTTIGRDADGAGQPDVLAYPTPGPGGGTAGPVRLFTSAPLSPLGTTTTLGGNWNSVRTATLAPDLTGDGNADIVAQDPVSGSLRTYAGDGAGRVTGFTSSGTSWGSKVSLLPVGDLNGDGHGDLMAVGRYGYLYFYPGAGDGTFGTGTFVSKGWTAYRSITAGPDRTGDGLRDLTAVHISTGRLYAIPTVSGGRLGTPRYLLGGWGPLPTVVSAGDLDGDHNADIIAGDSAGQMRTYYGDAGQVPARLNFWGSGWRGVDQLSGGVDFTGDGHADVLGVYRSVSNGQMRVYHGTGRRDLRPGPTIAGLTGADTVQLVGDVDGDGHTDAVARVGDSLLGLRGTGRGGFGAPFVLGAHGWAAMTRIAAAGDLSYDGIPDLVATVAATGQVYRYGLTRSFTLQSAIALEQGWGGYRAVTGVGAWNTDANGDVVVLQSDGTLRLFRGSGDAPLLDSVVLRVHTTVRQIVGVGDYNGDHLPDIVGVDAYGGTWLYSGLSNGRLASGRQPMTGGPGAGWTIG